MGLGLATVLATAPLPQRWPMEKALPGPTLNALHALTPISSYWKLLSGLMPSHLTEAVREVLAAT